MNEQDQNAPEGFRLLPDGLGFTDVLRPVYRREEGAGVAIGMFVQAQHCNMIGICHGGVLMTLSDVGAASAVNHAREKIGGAPTLNLSFDFIAAAKAGEWIEAQADRVELRKRFGFSSGVVSNAEGKVICRFSGTFYMPDHTGYDANIAEFAKLHGVKPSD
jgi:uncharacterized protein (TIGR00369 family)